MILQLWDFFFLLGTQEQVWNSHGKPAIIVLATEVLLYMAVSGSAPRGGNSLILEGTSIQQGAKLKMAALLPLRLYLQ